MKKNAIVAAVALLLFALGALPMCCQTTVPVTGKIVGKDGKPLAGAQVVYTNLGNNRTYKVKTDKNGEFVLVGMPYDDYQVEVFGPDGQSVYRAKRSLTSDPESSRLAVDLSKAPKGSQPAAAKEQTEALKEKNAQIIHANELITQVNTAMQAKQWQQAEGLLKQLAEIYPDNWEYFQGLGNAQINQGEYDDALKSYKQGIEIAQGQENSTDPKVNSAKAKAGVAQMLTGEGNAYLKLGRTDDAIGAYSKAAELDPNPGTAYFNICATQYNMGNTEGALAACDKAIAADPAKADAYFIKGSLLLANSKMDAKGNAVAPPGTAEALKKYLELSPEGPHAADVKAMLEYIGSNANPTYHHK